MKVHLIKKQTIESFIIQNANILGRGSDRVVFNIGGNKYRMICKYHFGTKKVHLFISWIGTHSAYSKLCNNNEQFSIEDN